MLSQPRSYGASGWVLQSECQRMEICGTFQNLRVGFAELCAREVPKSSIAKFFVWYARSSRRNRTMVSHTLCSFPSIHPPARHIHCWRPLEAVQYTFSASPIVHLSRVESTSMQVLYCVCYSHARSDSQWDGLFSFSECDADFSAHLLSDVVQMRNSTHFFRVDREPEFIRITKF